MFTRSIAVFMTAGVLVTVSPAMAQSSDLLASAERLALMTEVEQDQSVVRRRRSGGLAWTGGGLAVAGIVLALRPPVCDLLGSERGERGAEFEAVYRRGRCDVRWSSGGGIGISTMFLLDTVYEPYAVFGDRTAIPKRTWNYVGWVTVAAGGSLMWFGLRGVDVPVRLDVAPTGRFRISRSLDW